MLHLNGVPGDRVSAFTQLSGAEEEQTVTLHLPTLGLP